MALPRRQRRRRYGAWLAAVLLHAVALALLLAVVRQRTPLEAQSPPGIAVVFDNGGEKQASTPKAPQPGPATPAISPPPLPPPPQPAPPQPVQPPAPAPAPQVAETQPDVRLDMPQDVLPMPQLPPVPTLEPLPPPQPARPAPRPQPRPAHKYLVMNGMSFGSGSAASQSTPNAQHGLNLAIPQADQQAADESLSIKGNAGADWDAALRKWVNDHAYYPTAAAEQGQQGYVRIRFTTDRNGNVTGLRLLNGSGSPFLDQAWLGLFQNGQLPPFPPDAKDDHVTVDAVMHYELEGPGG